MILESSDAQLIIRFKESSSTVCKCESPSRAPRLKKVAHGIGVDLEDILVECRVNSDDVPHLMVDLELQRRHGRVEVNSIEVLQKQDLRVSFTSVSGFR